MSRMTQDPDKQRRPGRRWTILAVAGLTVIALAAGAASFVVDREAAPRTSGRTVVNGRTVVMPVTGMSCVSCAAHIKRAVQRLNGVSSVEVSLADRTMEVTYNPSVVTPQQIAATVNALGYRAGAPIEAR